MMIVTNARSWGGKDGFVPSQLINVSPDLPLQLQRLRNTLLYVHCSRHTSLQTVSSRDQRGLFWCWQASSQCSSLFKLNQLGFDVLNTTLDFETEIVWRWQNLDCLGYLVLIHIIENNVESFTGKDHCPALADQTRPNNSNFFISNRRHGQ